MYELFDLMRIGADDATTRILNCYPTTAETREKINNAKDGERFLRISDIWADNSKEFAVWYADSVTNNGYMYHTINFSDVDERSAAMNNWFEEMILGDFTLYSDDEDSMPHSKNSLLFTSAAKFEEEPLSSFVKYEQDAFVQRPISNNESGASRVETFVTTNGECEALYFENDTEQVISLSYNDTPYRLMIVLPRETSSDSQPWKNYSSERIRSRYNSLQKTSSIDCHLAVFSTSTDAYLRASTAQLGSSLERVKDLLDSVNYPKIFITEALVKLEPIRHKTAFCFGLAQEVRNEIPTDLPPIQFNANAKLKFVTNRPFLYIFYHENVGIEKALFVGIYE